MRHFEAAGSSKPSLNIKKQPKTAFLGIKSCAKLPRSKISCNDPYYLFLGFIWDLYAKFQPGKKSFFFFEIFAGVTFHRYETTRPGTRSTRFLFASEICNLYWKKYVQTCQYSSPSLVAYLSLYQSNYLSIYPNNLFSYRKFGACRWREFSHKIRFGEIPKMSVHLYQICKREW